jgi:arsenate reductase
VRGIMAWKIYTLANCDRCRAATKWLRAQNIAFEEIAIREHPPSAAELRLALRSTGEIRPLFNTSGRDYRERKLGSKLDTMPPEAALALLAENGNLVKRPFLIGDGIALVGFDETKWRNALKAPCR